MAMESGTVVYRRNHWAHLGVVVLAAAIAACEMPTELPRFESTWRFPTEDVELVVAGVAGSTSVAEDLSDVDVNDDVRSAVIRILPVNPAGASGVVSFTIDGGGITVAGSVDVANASVQTVPLTQAEVRALLGNVVTFTASGTLCRASGCGLAPPPFPVVTLDTELEIVVEVGGRN